MLYIETDSIFCIKTTIHAKLFTKNSCNMYFSIKLGQEQWFLYFWGCISLESQNFQSSNKSLENEVMKHASINHDHNYHLKYL